MENLKDSLVKNKDYFENKTWTRIKIFKTVMLVFPFVAMVSGGFACYNITTRTIIFYTISVIYNEKWRGGCSLSDKMQTTLTYKREYT